MATLSDLQQAIDDLLEHPLGVNNFQLVNSVSEKAYEAYVFGLCLRAVRELGVTPVLRGITGVPTPFIFRGAPGRIHSRYRNYGYAEFSLNGHPFEVHAGVEFLGTSGVTHELDVAILRGVDAQSCRQGSDDPKSASLVAGWECKFYSRTLDKGLGRQFLGLVEDLSANMRVDGLCSNANSGQLRNLYKKQSRPFPHFQLTPLATSNEDVFVNVLKAGLKQMTGS